MIMIHFVLVHILVVLMSSECLSGCIEKIHQNRILAHGGVPYFKNIALSRCPVDGIYLGI